MGKIKTKDTSKILSNYLESNDLSKLNISEKENIVRKIILDYKKGEISLDELSSLCETIWWSLPETDKHGNSFGDTLMSAMELSFYERNVKDEESAKRFMFLMQDLTKFE